MANVIPDQMRNDLWKGALADLSSSGVTVKAALILSSFTPVAATHRFYSDISAQVVGTPVAIANKTVGTLGVGIFDGDDVTFSAVAGLAVGKLAIYIDTGTTTTSKILAFVDQVTSGLLVTPNGGNITVTWDAVNGILKI
jgi:hypothetical protein